MKLNHPSIKETGDRSVFSVPENYFVQFKADLNSRLDAFEAEKLQTKDVQIPLQSGKPVFKMDTIRPFLYVAAMFVLLLFSIGLILNRTSDKSLNSLGLSVERNTGSTNSIPTTEDYLINSVGIYGITEYYLDSETQE